MTLHWSTHQLTEYFTAVSSSADEEVAIRVAVERALEALDAEVGAVLLAGENGVRGLTGLPVTVPAEQVRPAFRGEPTVELPLLGEANGAHATLGSDIDGELVVARIDDVFSTEERQMLQGMAQVLGLALRNLRILTTERALREERAREARQRLELLEVLRARQTLLETLLSIQRAISRREPLQSVLDAITEGVSGLLGQAPIALVLSDPAEPTSLIVASRAHWPESAGTANAALELAAEAIAVGDTVVRSGPSEDLRLATPVHVSGVVAGGLVAVGLDETDSAVENISLLSAFGQQISLALTDARTVEAVREAYRDPLTGLPNRKLFLERLDQILGDPRVEAVVILFVDLDRFKSVNDSLGHNAGDELLAAVSERILACLRTGDLAARLGGDEFAVLIEGVSVEDARVVAERIAIEVAEPFHVAGRPVYIGSSIGIAARAGGTTASELLGNADVAMYRAKRTGSGQVVVFEPEMHAEQLTRLELRADLQHALVAGQFRLDVQPLVRLATGELEGVEALLRWHHPRRGIVPPDQFIPITEETGLINEIGRWALREAVSHVASWRRLLPGLTVSVNVSARQITDDRFVTDVADALDSAGVDGSALTLELTETVLTTDPAKALTNLRLIKKRGVRLSVDDFGTGYSSLSYLRQFPVDQVKIDRSFVSGVTRSAQDNALVRAVVDLGRALHLEVVAEGIEDVEQLQALVRMGCDLGQGYHLHRPMDPQLFADVIQQGGRARSALMSTSSM
ncbi:putative bifunctional diguanylate cyclase/phosphodiesterase [Actinoplanes aureus]|uniref:EAL domain-containing protein n=1 Tax=Actinoplanes aureus TaxID=2792083 RepID=A0A931G7X5_9ACTN|nr:EAL domain-containing protein [Actinoplanes aureus]MBG0568694.1 EAL domain-containing protein [Actinoplanes aureus]